MLRVGWAQLMTLLFCGQLEQLGCRRLGTGLVSRKTGVGAGCGAALGLLPAAPGLHMVSLAGQPGLLNRQLASQGRKSEVGSGSGGRDCKSYQGLDLEALDVFTTVCWFRQVTQLIQIQGKGK